MYSGKVDLGTGLRISFRQIVAEELGIPVERINLIEGDTALTPDQGRTSGSNGIQVGGMQFRQASATARKALIDLAAKRLNVPADDLITADGEVRGKSGGPGIKFAELLAGNKFDLKLDPKAPLKDPRTYTIVGKPLRRPDVPAKVNGTFVYMHDFKVPDMLHGRVIRPPAIGAELKSVDEASIASLPGVKVVRVKNFLGVVAEDEWTCVRAMRALKAEWSDWQGLPDQSKLREQMRAGPFEADETIINKGTPAVAPSGERMEHKATYYWPAHTHGSIGPSCAIADIKADGATIWTASQGTHGNQTSFARFLGLPKEKVRLIYLDGAGCYGMNGHEDAAADAAIMSRATGRPVRVQWMREDEHGWDPKGPPQLIDISSSFDMQGRIGDWKAELFIPRTTRGLPNIPLVGPESAGYQQPMGINTGLISQNADPPYRAGSIIVVAHWLKDTPLRPAPIRSPGKPANCFAVESFIDEMAAKVRQDPVQVRLDSLTDERGKETLRRIAAMLKWDSRPSPGPDVSAAVRARSRHRLHPLQARGGLCGDRHGGRGRARDRPHPGRADRVRARLRADHQSGWREGADRRQHPPDAEPRHDGGDQVRPLARHHARLGELSDHALLGDPAARDRADRPAHREAGRCGRGGLLPGRAGARQCGLRRDRRPPARDPVHARAREGGVGQELRLAALAGSPDGSNNDDCRLRASALSRRRPLMFATQPLSEGNPDIERTAPQGRV